MLVHPESSADHILFKPTGGRSREGRFQQDPKHFQHERAARIGFILPTLQDPDEIRQTKREPVRRLYISQVGNEELFLVIVERCKNRQTRFVTAMEVRLTVEWQRWQWKAKIKETKLIYKRSGRP